MIQPRCCCYELIMRERRYAGKQWRWARLRLCARQAARVARSYRRCAHACSARYAALYFRGVRAGKTPRDYVDEGTMSATMSAREISLSCADAQAREQMLAPAMPATLPRYGRPRDMQRQRIERRSHMPRVTERREARRLSYGARYAAARSLPLFIDDRSITDVTRTMIRYRLRPRVCREQ